MTGALDALVIAGTNGSIAWHVLGEALRAVRREEWRHGVFIWFPRPQRTLPRRAPGRDRSIMIVFDQR